MLEPGTLIGRYEVQRRLGRGGMGAVYVAHDPQLGRMVAIKVLAGDVEEAEALERFKREARSAASLNHPNLVTVYDFDRFESQPYLVMEYVPGRTMAEVIRRKEPITIGEKLRWMEDLCTGAGYAHQMSVVHRDIKPANLMLTRSGQLKILDFGIARMLGITSNTGSMVGTPGYMAPEQIEGDALDHRADLFSIGVVCYELLSYREAFPGDTLPAVTHSVLSREPIPLPQLVSDLHPDLVAIVERALRKNKHERFQDTETLRGAIARVRQLLEADATQGAVPTFVAPTPAAPRPSDAEGGGSSRPSGSSPSLGSSGTPHPERVRTDREALARLRATQLDAALQRSRTLVREGSLQEALEQCHIALTFDEDHSEALDLEQSIQAALDQKAAEGLIEEGRELVGRGSLTEARSRLERARELATDVAPVKRFERELRHAVVDQERVRKRAETVSGMVRSAQDALQAGQVEEALAAAREALDLDTTSEAARTVEIEALRRLEGTGPMSPLDPPGPASDATVVRSSSASHARAEATVVRPSPVTPPPQAPAVPATPRPNPAAAKSAVRTDPLAWARPVLAGIGPALARAGHSVGEGARRARASLPDARTLTKWPPRGMALAAWGVVGAAVVALAVAAALMPRPPAEVPTGAVVVDAVPWGTITAIKRQNGENVPVPSPATTPVSITLPAGTYEIVLAGPDTGPTRTLTVRVEAGGMAAAPVERFSPPSVDDYFTPYLAVPAASPDASEPDATTTGAADTPPVPAAPPGASR